MKRQKTWNLLTAVAVGFLALGCFAAKAGADVMGKCLVLPGVLALAASIVGSSRTYKKHPCKCPVCGSEIRPAGRWLPGLGFNGTNTVSCSSCGAITHIQDLNQESFPYSESGKDS